MQFGRFHGVSLLILGGMLLLVQGVLSFQGLHRTATRPQPTDQSAGAESRSGYQPLHRVEYIPGIAGLILVAGGVLLLVRYQRNIVENFSRTHTDPDSGAEPRGGAIRP
jgi:hypothetical protein